MGSSPGLGGRAADCKPAAYPSTHLLARRYMALSAAASAVVYATCGRGSEVVVCALWMGVQRAGHGRSTGTHIPKLSPGSLRTAPSSAAPPSLRSIAPGGLITGLTTSLQAQGRVVSEQAAGAASGSAEGGCRPRHATAVQLHSRSAAYVHSCGKRPGEAQRCAGANLGGGERRLQDASSRCL